MRHSFALALAGAAVAATAVLPSTGAARTCATTKLTARANGTSVSLARCQTLVISLSQSSDGGYLWHVATKPAASVLKLASATEVRPSQPPGVVGGNTTEVFVFKAVGPGTTRLKLVESRSFERHSAAQTFTLKVTVA